LSIARKANEPQRILHSTRNYYINGDRGVDILYAGAGVNIFVLSKTDAVVKIATLVNSPTLRTANFSIV
jgi:hypothetical protein